MDKVWLDKHTSSSAPLLNAYFDEQFARYPRARDLAVLFKAANYERKKLDRTARAKAPKFQSFCLDLLAIYTCKIGRVGAHLSELVEKLETLLRSPEQICFGHKVCGRSFVRNQNNTLDV
jgi:hypothetical protein